MISWSHVDEKNCGMNIFFKRLSAIMFLSAMSLKFFIFELFALVWSYLCDMSKFYVHLFYLIRFHLSYNQQCHR